MPIGEENNLISNIASTIYKNNNEENYFNDLISKIFRKNTTNYDKNFLRQAIANWHSQFFKIEILSDSILEQLIEKILDNENHYMNVYFHCVNDDNRNEKTNRNQEIKIFLMQQINAKDNKEFLDEIIKKKLQRVNSPNVFVKIFKNYISLYKIDLSKHSSPSIIHEDSDSFSYFNAYHNWLQLLHLFNELSKKY